MDFICAGLVAVCSYLTISNDFSNFVVAVKFVIIEAVGSLFAKVKSSVTATWVNIFLKCFSYLILKISASPVWIKYFKSMYWFVICYIITHFSFPPFCVLNLFVILNMVLSTCTQILWKRKERPTNWSASVFR